MKKPDIDPEPDIEARFWIPEIEHHATAVGYICIIYSKIEFYVDSLTRLVINVQPEVGRAVATSSGKLERRISLLRHCIVVAAPTIGWLEATNQCLDDISREVPLKNRIIHDVWINAETPTQADSTARLKAPASHRPKITAPVVETPRNLDDLWELHKRLQSLNDRLRILEIEYRMWRSFQVLPKSEKQ